MKASKKVVMVMHTYKTTNKTPLYRGRLQALSTFLQMKLKKRSLRSNTHTGIIKYDVGVR
ncbi:MAG: hypothetical protein Fur006_66930 [Coleofasciculaceae cyanobacterium]